MKEHPILFSAPMIRAVLEGRKGQTRRTRGFDLFNISPNCQLWQFLGFYDGVAAFRNQGERKEVKCPYGVPGDRLYVRESCAISRVGDDEGAPLREPTVLYKADGYPVAGIDGYLKHPSIHMPRWASRILLEVTDVRVQRIQEISVNDCQSEGADFSLSGDYDFDLNREVPYHANFRRLWNAINEKRDLGWSVNPWVWPISFKVVKP